MSDLPEGWASARLHDICELINGRAYKQDELLDKGKYPVLRVGNFFSNRSWYYSDLNLDPEKYCDSGDLLYAWSASFGPRIWDGGKVIFHYHIWKTRLVDALIKKRFLYHWFEWDKENIKSDHGTGSTMIHVTKGDMEARRFALPPLLEQQRIVAKIDSLTGISRRARDHLDHIPRLVEKYKQAILAAAFRGDLTREWRANHHSTAPDAKTLMQERQCLLAAHQQRSRQYETNGVEDAGRPFELPDGWAWVRAEAICGFITKGTTPGSDLMSSGDGEIPFIKVYNLTFDGTLDFTVDPTFVSNATHGGFLGRSKVYPGDILMNIVGPPLGKVSVVSNQYAQWNINQAIAVFRPVPSVLPVFLCKWLLTDVLTRWAVSRSKATAGQSNLTLEICRNLPVPICSHAEQVEIVRKIDAAMNWVNRLAADATSARHLVDRLDQAVLAKAFKGELISQDPGDEPASMLLDRIRAERAAAPKPKRGSKKAA